MEVTGSVFKKIKAIVADEGLHILSVSPVRNYTAMVPVAYNLVDFLLLMVLVTFSYFENHFIAHVTKPC